MIGVDRLVGVLSTIAASGLVKNGEPISVVLVAPSDAGKSALISKTCPRDARVVNDFTTWSMSSMLSEPKPPRIIVVPDFNAVISHKPAVAQLTMAFLLALLAEGISEIPGVAKNGESAKAKLKVKTLKKRGIRIALITGMTPEMFYGSRGKWRATGLLRRLIPVYYTYSTDTVKAIQKSIKKGLDTLDYTIQKQARLKPRAITVPAHLADAIEGLAEHVVNNQLVWKRRDLSGKTVIQRAHDFPFSTHKMFRNYVKASALARGAKTASRIDIKNLRDFARFVRYDRPEEL